MKKLPFNLQETDVKFTNWDKEDMEEMRRDINALYDYLNLERYNFVPQKRSWLKRLFGV